MREFSVIQDKFFQLLQMAVGEIVDNTISLSDKEWADLHTLSLEQSLLGVYIKAVEKLISDGLAPPKSILYQWIAESEAIRQQNKKLDQQCAQLTARFKSAGYGSCVLKGQGISRLYPDPELRQAGDIDIWITGSTENITESTNISMLRDHVIGMMRDSGVEVSVVDYVNCHANFYKDTEVEVHFRPTYMFNPFVDRKLQSWIRDNKEVQTLHYDETMGFSYPTIGFNLVFSLIHIYRHVFLEGIGLRQLMDYYFILKHSSVAERTEALVTLQSFGLRKFAATIMYIMQKVFKMNPTFMLCEPNEEEGTFLLEEILRGGNFGHYDDRNTYVSDDQKIKRGINNAKRNLRFLKHYPSEVIWAPAWKTWHWCWRKWKGYL